MITFLFWLVCIVSTILFGLSFILPVNVSSGIHGTAAFSNEKILSTKNKGFVVDGIRRLTAKNSFIHSATVASTGAGKTTRIILPNVLQLDDCSMVISDPKGEIHDLTKHDLARRGFKVKVIDFSDIQHSARFNPLLRANTEGEIKQIASSFYDMSNAGTKTEGIWRLGAVRLLEVLILSLKNQPDPRLANMRSLINMINHVENGTDTVERFVMKYAPTNAKNLFKAFSSNEVKIKLGQLASATACLAPFDTEDIRTLTATDSINFDDFRKEKTALFLKLPVGVSRRYAPVLNLFYTQFWQYLLNTSVAPSDLPMYFLLDEFANIPKIPSFTSTLTLIRSKRVSINIIVQSISQLDVIYGQSETETILSNTASLMVYGGLREKRSLDYITQMIGNTTKEIHTPGAFGISFHSRPLLTNDELRRLPSSRGLFLFSNKNAQKIRPTPIYQNKELMARAGISSINGELVADEPALELESPSEKLDISIPPVTIEDDLTNPHIREAKEKLREILP